MCVSGVIGWVMIQTKMPVAPAILGMVLGPLLEKNLLTSMVKSQGDIISFFDRPIAGTLGVITVLVWTGIIVGAISKFRLQNRSSRNEKNTELV